LLRLTRIASPLTLACASYIGAVTALFLVDDPAAAPAMLFAIPIALFTFAGGFQAGVVAATLAMLAVVAQWEVSDLDLGASAYVTRAVVFCSIPALISWASRGRSRASDEPPEVAPRQRGRVDSSYRRSLGLSKRELQVLQLLALGHTNPEIADQLVISVRTVEGHRARLQRKIGRSGRAELVSFALERELIGNPN
jgi:DNA-binding CsgD family transcriptional regulator